MKRTMSITNRTGLPRPIYVEPEGADYWMLPEQTFQLRADVNDPCAQFEILDNGDSLQVWPSNDMASSRCSPKVRNSNAGTKDRKPRD